jgi:hypothetical protein
MVAYYDERPSVFSKTNTQITYRWDIVEEINEENNTISYKCNEITLYRPVCREELIQAVINELWDNDREKKLINDYNSALINQDNNSDAVGRYIEFLTERDRIKEQVKEDFKRINL